METGNQSVMNRAESVLLKAIELGKSGAFSVVPGYFFISATDNCNLRCIMCPGHTGMAGSALSLKQAEALFGEIDASSSDFGLPNSLDVTAGEATLNRELNLIFRMFKQRFPQGTIQLISNGTLPLKGRVREIFELADNVCLSIDGASEVTYERIRRGSRFKNVVRNVKDIAELKDGNVGVIFVAMDQNIHEMRDMVKLCGELGVRNLHIQAVYTHGAKPFMEEGDNVSLDAPPELIKKYLDEAAAEAATAGVSLSIPAGLLAYANPVSSKASSNFEKGAVNQSDHLDGVRFCSVPWLFSPRMNYAAGQLGPSTPCCHMVPDASLGNLSGGYPGKSIKEIFNSAAYWRIREGLIDGTMAKNACRNCQHYKTFQWTPAQLSEIEKAIERALLRTNARKRVHAWPAACWSGWNPEPGARL